MFDAQQVPVQAVDSHLPAIPAPRLHAQALQKRFANPSASHWGPQMVQEALWDVARAPTAAAVLLPLVQRESLSVLLTTRAAKLSSHAGQVAFPGGKVDAQDADAVAAALREAQEEIGLQPQYVDVLGTLPLYTTGSNFLVTPVVALVKPGFAITPSPAEVAEVFEVPLAFLMNPSNHRHHTVEWQGQQRQWLSMPYPTQIQGQVREYFIWGATAGILRNLYHFLAAP